MYSNDERLTDLICAVFAVVAAIIIASTTGLGMVALFLLLLLPKMVKAFGRFWAKQSSKLGRLRAQLAAADRERPS